MVEVKFIGCATRYTLATIARPHFKLYASWNDATTLNKTISVFFRGRFVRHALNCDELEFEYISNSVALNPRIDKVKEPVISPNAGFDFLVDLNDVWAFFTSLELLRSIMELTVLGQSPARLPVWLIEQFWVGNALSFRLIMPFGNLSKPH